MEIGILILMTVLFFVTWIVIGVNGCSCNILPRVEYRRDDFKDSWQYKHLIQKIDELSKYQLEYQRIYREKAQQDIRISLTDIKTKDLIEELENRGEAIDFSGSKIIKKQ